MTPKERLFARLQGKEVDKIPNLNIVMQFAARFTNTPYSEFVTDYRALVDSQSKTAEHFHLDIMSTMSDPFRETADFGASISFPHDSLPVCDKRPVSDIAKWESSLKSFNPAEGKRCSDRIKAVELFKQRYGEEYPILGWVEGALAELCDLGGVNDIMISLCDDEDAVKDALDFISEHQVKFAVEQVKAGADFVGLGDAVASLISADMYSDLAFLYEKKIIDAVHEAGGKVKLHICGNINHILPKMVETGADIIDIDYYVDFKHATELCKDKIAVCGNIDPVEIIYQGKPELIKQCTRDLIKVMPANGILSGGCEVPRDTAFENLMAMHEVLAEEK